jgi:hypothetical protein
MTNTKRTGEDWQVLFENVRQAVNAGVIPPVMKSAAKYLGVNYRTFQTAVNKYWPGFHNEFGSNEIVETENIRQEKTENTWSINSTHPEIHTIEQLLDYCQVDQSVWMVEGNHGLGPVLNSWPTTAKKKATNLSYSTEYDDKDRPHTLIEGSIHSDGELVSKTNIQIKVRLRRIVPVATIPVIRPIQIINPPKLPPVMKSDKEVRRVLFIADPHFGFYRNIHTSKLSPIHDRRVLDIALQIAENEEFDDITFLGDMLDLAEWSTRWVTTPEFYWTTQPTLIEAHWWLRKFREAQPKAVIDALEGNHNRFKQAIVSNLKAAYELRAVDELALAPAISLPKLLALHELNIGFIDGYDTGEAEKWFSDSVLATHNDSASGTPGATAKNVVNKNMFTTIFGHIHRRELVTIKVETRDGPVTHTAVCPGCACRLDAKVPGNKLRQQWQQGVMPTNYSPDDLAPPEFDMVEIHEGRAIYNGRVIEARDIDGMLDEFVSGEMERIGS